MFELFQLLQTAFTRAGYEAKNAFVISLHQNFSNILKVFFKINISIADESNLLK